MKLAKYFLLLTVLAIMAIGIIGVGVGLFGPHPSRKLKPMPQNVEFVDIDQVVRQHPDVDALKSIEYLLASVNSAQSNVSRLGISAAAGRVGSVSARAQAAIPRWQLEANMAQEAAAALQQLKLEQLMALQGRIQSTRKTMLDSAEADLTATTREIQQSTAARTTAITAQCAFEVTNVELKIKALKAVLGKPGVNDAEINRRLALLESELLRYQQSVQGETQQVSESAQSSIEALRKSAETKIDAAMSAYSRSETLKIQKKIDDAQSQIMADVVSFDELSAAELFGAKPAPEVKAKTLRVPAVVAGRPFNADQDLSIWKAKADALKRRIRSEVISEVRAVAAQRNTRVVFVRKNALIPDQTELYAKLLSGRMTGAGAPVLYGNNGI